MGGMVLLVLLAWTKNTLLCFIAKNIHWTATITSIQHNQFCPYLSFQWNFHLSEKKKKT